MRVVRILSHKSLNIWNVFIVLKYNSREKTRINIFTLYCFINLGPLGY